MQNSHFITLPPKLYEASNMSKHDTLAELRWRVKELELELGITHPPVEDDPAVLQKQTQLLLPLEPPPALLHHTVHFGRDTSFDSGQTPLLNSREWTQELPSKVHNWTTRHLRFTIFSVYRRLFAFVFLVNVAALIRFLFRYHGVLDIPLSEVATAVSANLTVAILIRQELVINMLFIVFAACPHWAPLRLRRSFAKLYHLGGVHSGCALSALLWFSLLTALIVRGFAAEDPPQLKQEPAIFILTIAINALLFSIVLFAHPTFRSMAHNVFEAIHRFAGWTVVGLFWVHVMLLTNLDCELLSPRGHFSMMLIQDPSFWMLCSITACLMVPWIHLRKVKVRSEFLSAHAIRIHFTYTNTAICTAPRVSDQPLKEWHAFAAIAEPDGRGFSVIVSNAGDWTRRVISSPPKQLWVRGIPTRGVLAIAPIFKRIVLVATGSGIAPCLSLLGTTKVSCRLLWSTPTPEITYGQSIMDDVYAGDKQAVVIDTKQCGRPDLVQLAYQMYVETAAEAVFIISNPKVTKKVVYSLESRGIPIFAPVFDS